MIVRDTLRPKSESQIIVTSDSTSANAELRPRIATVKKKKTAQTLAPGISDMASG